MNLIGRRFSQKTIDNHFLSPILIIRIHPCPMSNFLYNPVKPPISPFFKGGFKSNKLFQDSSKAHPLGPGRAWGPDGIGTSDSKLFWLRATFLLRSLSHPLLLWGCVLIRHARSAPARYRARVGGHPGRWHRKKIAYNSNNLADFKFPRFPLSREWRPFSLITTLIFLKRG